MKVFRTLPLIALLLCCFSLSVFAADIPSAPEWDAVLDGIYAHTWRGRADLDAELRKEEARIKQDLPGYVAAWERRMAAPIVYTDSNRGGGACGPLPYCAADILDPRSFIERLRDKKEPLSRFLFEKLSPEAQKAIIGCDLTAFPGKNVSTPAAPTVEGATAKVTRLLTDELSRIVRGEALFDEERFAGVRLSYAAITLVNKHNNADQLVCVNKTLLTDAFPELARNFKCVIPKDETYRRVVAAKTVQYLRTGKKKNLDESIILSENFEDKLTYTDFAFWYYYP